MQILHVEDHSIVSSLHSSLSLSLSLSAGTKGLDMKTYFQAVSWMKMHITAESLGFR